MVDNIDITNELPTVNSDKVFVVALWLNNGKWFA